MRPQHNRSVDSGIDLLYDSKDKKDSLKKRPRSLSLVSLNSSDWSDYWERKTSQLRTTELPNKKTKTEQVIN